jgi:hypothetical protein
MAASAESTMLNLHGNVQEKLARPRRFERPTFAFGGQRSIQLSYGRLIASIDQTAGSGNLPGKT